MESIRIEVSPGELIDKITILEIKSARMKDTRKLVNVRHELAVLRSLTLEPSPRLTELTHALKQVNTKLWDIEDAIRRCEADHDFGPRFVALARAVYHENDERAALKRQINELFSSSIVEEKEYVRYGA